MKKINKYMKGSGASEGRAARYESLVMWSFLVRLDISYNDPVEKQYYSSKKVWPDLLQMWKHRTRCTGQ